MPVRRDGRRAWTANIQDGNVTEFDLLNSFHLHGMFFEAYRTGTATAVHLGRTSASYEVVITDERGKRVCTSRITCTLLPRERFQA